MAGIILMLLGAAIILYCLGVERRKQTSGGGNETVANLVARYPAPVILRQPTGRLVAISLLCAFGVASGYWMTMTGAENGVTVLSGFGILGAFCAFLFLKGLPTLTLDTDGFEVGSRIRTVRLNWHSVTRFYGIRFKSLSGNNFVRYDATPGQPWLMLGGFEISADELTELLTLWRAKALGSRVAAQQFR